MADPMQLSAFDFLELQVHGPTGLTEDQYFRIVKAVERIKGAAFQDGRLAEREWQRARKELANAKADTEHAEGHRRRYARAIGHAAEVLHEQTCKDNQHDDDPIQVWPCFQLATQILKEIKQ